MGLPIESSPLVVSSSNPRSSPELFATPETHPSGVLRWAPPPAVEGSAARRDEPFQTLLRWTNGLDDERAITLWAILCAVEHPATREATLLRWIHWAEVIVALDVKLSDLVVAFDVLLAEVELLASHAERVYLYPAADLRPLTRALQGWMRARAPMPGGRYVVYRLPSQQPTSCIRTCLT